MKKQICLILTFFLMLQSLALPVNAQGLPEECSSGFTAVQDAERQAIPADLVVLPLTEEPDPALTFYYEEREPEGSAAQAALPDAAYWMQYHPTEAYQLLTADERRLWSRMEAACIAVMGDSTSTVGFIRVDSDDLTLDHLDGTQLNYMFKLSHPQFFVLSNSISSYAGGVSVYQAFQSGPARAAAIEEFRTVVDDWVAQADAAELPEEKEHIIHDLICTNCTYDHDAVRDYSLKYDEYTRMIDWDQGAFSLIHDGKTVCGGYAAATGLLLTKLGIPTLNVTSAGHAWNYVKLHHHWFLLDVTFDDDSFGSWIYMDYNAIGMNSDGSFPGGHEPEQGGFADWASLVPETKDWSNCDPDEDCYSGNHENPYFTVDGYRYFVVNGCTDYGLYTAELVDSPAGLDIIAAPETVTCLTKTYRVTRTVEPEPTPDPIPDPAPDPTPDPTPEPEGVSGFVTRLYHVFLDRNPGQEEVEGWASQITNGSITAGQAAAGFIFSPEFISRNMCNDHFLDYLYLGLFDRAADADGKNGWTLLMDEGYSREMVAQGFLTSPEFMNLCDSYGVSCGTGLEYVPALGTIQAAHCTIAGCPNEAPVVILVTGLYDTVFQRVPAQEEVDFWVHLMS
nr:DUF4214 domain-containing protein [Lachnospiraceae bacterium]